MARDDDDWTPAQEVEWERQEELRHEYAEDEYEARRARNAHRCQCVGMDMPGSCPGPRNCPLADHDEADMTGVISMAAARLARHIIEAHIAEKRRELVEATLAARIEMESEEAADG